MSQILNIASTLRETALQFPNVRGVVWPVRRNARSPVDYAHVTFRELDDESMALAAGLQTLGVRPGTRIVLMVRPGLEFIALTFALFKAGAVVVLIDPGMGPRQMFRCLDQVEPEGFVAIPPVQAMRLLNRGRFPKARFNVTVGRRWFWGGPTYKSLNVLGASSDNSPGSPNRVLAPTRSTDPAAIIFTSGSTGPAKGVVYEHGMFAAQVETLKTYYAIPPGGLDLPGLPLFALFNAALGVTTVIPDMNPARPAQVDPERIVSAIRSLEITQGFGSPAIWNRVGRYCDSHSIQLPSLQRVFSAGAPVPVDVLARMRRTLVGTGAEMHTPYGATEALPVSSITASDVLEKTAAKTRQGAGTCVGRPFPNIRLRIIDICAGPILSLGDTLELKAGEIGEIIVQGDVVTREYFRRPDATAFAKIPDGAHFWHRMGDVGYLDADGALWFCGRKAHIVETEQGRMYTDCVEPIINSHAHVNCSALVGVGPKPRQTPVIVVELECGTPSDGLRSELCDLAATHPNTRPIEHFLFFPQSLPVDVRHNTKINREQLAVWAERQLSRRGSPADSASKSVRGVTR